MSEYRPRVVDAELEKLLEMSGAVEIRGTKWCGKTTTALQQAKSVVYMDDEELGEENIAMARAFPRKFLEGTTPKLIDEWQLCPSIWDSVRREVDIRDEFGQFILTGSSTPKLIKNESGKMASPTKHTGFGRIAKLLMRPMSLFESGDSSGEVSLKTLFDSNGEIPVFGSSDKELEDMAFLLCRGGWPGALKIKKKEYETELPSLLLDELIAEDIPRLIDVRKSSYEIRQLIRSYARAESTQAAIAAIQADLTNGSGITFDIETVKTYIEVLRKLFIIEDMDAWNPNLRSKAAIQTSPTRHFADVSLAAAALGAGPDALLKDKNTFGLLFEGMAIRDLRVYSEKLNGTLHHYRDNTGLEADAVIQLSDGRWAPIEVKLFNPDRIEEGARNLKRLKNKIDTDRMLPPSFMMVVTAGHKAILREDGVYVVPLSMLAP